MISQHRNWDFHWSETGASGDSCSQAYYGPEPFSEVNSIQIYIRLFNLYTFLVRQVEARNVRDWVGARKDRIVFYQTLHSYSQLILIPWYFEPLLFRCVSVFLSFWIYSRYTHLKIGCCRCKTFFALYSTLDRLDQMANVPSREKTWLEISPA